MASHPRSWQRLRHIGAPACPGYRYHQPTPTTHSPLAAPPFRCTCLAPLPPLLDSIFKEPIWRLHHIGAPAMQLTNEYNVPQYIPQVTLAQYTSTSLCTRITSSSIAAAPPYRCTRLPSLHVYYPTHACNIHAIGSPFPNSSNKSLSEHHAASPYRCTCQTPLPTPLLYYRLICHATYQCV